MVGAATQQQPPQQQPQYQTMGAEYNQSTINSEHMAGLTEDADEMSNRDSNFLFGCKPSMMNQMSYQRRFGGESSSEEEVDFKRAATPATSHQQFKRK